MTALGPASSLRLFGLTVGGLDFNGAYNSFLKALREPSADPTLTLLFVAAAALLVLLIALAVAMVATPSRKRVVKVRRYRGSPEEIAAARAAVAARAASAADEGDREESPAKPEKGGPRPFWSRPTFFIVVGVVILALAAYGATSTNAYCARTCHGGTPAVRSATKVGHAPCTSCHEDNAITGVFDNTVARAAMLAGQAAGRSPDTPNVAAESAACLHCHEAVKTGIVESSSGVKMSHAEPLKAGQPCTSCHPDTGHVSAGYTMGMPPCLPCHDGKTAPITCSLCHRGDPMSPVVAAASNEASGGVSYPAVRAANHECGGCHDQEQTCDPCHGIRMPHSQTFIEGGHARYAAWNNKQTYCSRCHQLSTCAGKCHTSFNGPTGHSADWEVMHQDSPWDSGCPCHSARSPRAGPLCYRCHDPKTKELLPLRP